MVTRLLTATAALALLAGPVSALTESQTRSSVNAILSNIGAVVISCPDTGKKDPAYVTICATTDLSTSLTLKEWALYSDWSSKVPYAFKQTRPWTASTTSSGSPTNYATFTSSDGTLYAVLVFASGSTTYLITTFQAAGAGTTSQSAGASTTSTTVISPSQLSSIVNDAAQPTRKGPLRFSAPTANSAGVLGPVVSVVARNMTLTQNFGKTEEVLKSTTTDTYDTQGREVSTVTTDAAGTITAQRAYIYQGDLLIKQTFTDTTGANTWDYTYDQAGNLATATRSDASGTRVSVDRYHATPNGYTSETFKATGSATSTSRVLQDQQGRSVRSEFGSGSSVFNTENSYEGNLNARSLITASGGIRSELIYKAGRVVRSITVIGSITPSSAPSVTLYTNLDAWKNPQLATVGDEAIEFGQPVVKSTSVIHYTYTYR